MYQIFNLLVESNIPLPELTEVETGSASITFQLSTQAQELVNLDWYHHWRQTNGELVFSAAKFGKDYFLRFHALADFQISSDCNKIRCYPCADVNHESVRHLLINQVIPRVISHNGRIVLHASAVSIKQSTIAFLGDSGWGKSTIAAFFHTQGYPLLTDDSLLIEQKNNEIVGLPSYIGARLWADSIGAVTNEYHDFHDLPCNFSKKQMIFQRNSITDNNDLPIRAFFILNPPNQSITVDKITIEAILGARAITEILKHSFSLDMTDKNSISKKFNNIGEIVSSGVIVYQLHYPYDHALLGNVCDVVIKALAGVSTPVQSYS